jgi:hypothetical protein
MLNPRDSADSTRAAKSAQPHGPASRARSRAVELLVKILASGDASVDEIAAALLVSAALIGAYASGRRQMPLEHQLLLAAFAIERTPRHARLAHRLRGQVRAAIAFAMRELSPRPTPSPPRYW